MARELSNGQMELSIRENSAKMKSQEKETIPGLMEVHTEARF